MLNNLHPASFYEQRGRLTKNPRKQQLFPLIHRHKENKAIQRSLKISFRELLTKLQYYGSIN